MDLLEIIPRWLTEIPEIVRKYQFLLDHVADQYKTPKMCDDAVRRNPYLLKHVPNYFKTQEMCEKTVENEPYSLKFVPDHFKMQEICDKAVRDDSSSLQFVPDWFELIELLPIAWHPSRYWDWCMSEDEKKETGKLSLFVSVDRIPKFNPFLGLRV